MQSIFLKVVLSNPDKEAQVNARNVNGATPLHIAVMVQNIHLVKLLIKYGADVNLKVHLFTLRYHAFHSGVQRYWVKDTTALCSRKEQLRNYQSSARQCRKHHSWR